MPLTPIAHVSLRFVGAGVVPSEITRLLSVRPSMAYAKGDPVPKHPERRRPTGIWCLESPLDENESVDVHVRFILETIEPNRGGLAQLAKNGFIPDVYCSVFSQDAERSEAFVSLSADTLTRIGGLGLSLSVCFYGHQPE
jgi:hypothetical protein